MATRMYLPASTITTAISPAVSSTWEATFSGFVRSVTRPTTIADAMATRSGTDADNSSQDVVVGQWVSAMPLTAGQTVTGSQALKAQMRGQWAGSGNNTAFTCGCRIIAGDGTTVRKVLVVATRDGFNWPDVTGSLTNRQWTATSAATNYTTVTDDYLVIEVGAGGDPVFGGHNTNFRLGDAAASDLPEDDASTDDYNPWFQLTDTLTFVSEAGAFLAPKLFTLLGLGT